jgi:hypothetical protein
MSETGRDAGDTCLMPHNPEVAGSNPAPATKVKGWFSDREPALDLYLVHAACARQLGRMSSHTCPNLSAAFTTITSGLP